MKIEFFKMIRMKEFVDFNLNNLRPAEAKSDKDNFNLDRHKFIKSINDKIFNNIKAIELSSGQNLNKSNSNKIFLYK
jgi:hypothetical protein